MITYVDTSTLLKIIIDEVGSDRANVVWRSAEAVASATSIVVEARAALAAAERGGRLTTRQHTAAKSELERLVEDLHLVTITSELIDDAAELAEIECLCGYDAVHLAAAMAVDVSVFSSADFALCEAAMRRGVHVANPLET